MNNVENDFFSTTENVIEDIKKGKIVIIVDDHDRENEGDLFCAAENVSPEIVNFMSKYGRGLICVPMKDKRLKELKIKNMIENPTEIKGCSFTVSVDYKIGTTTGISAFDRCITIKKLIDKNANPEDFSKPGHIFPLRSNDGGVLVRMGHTEAAVDLAELAGLYPAGIICEIMNDDGTMARVTDLIRFSKKYKLKIITIKEIVNYKSLLEKSINKIVCVDFPTKYGDFKLVLFECDVNKDYHLAIIKGNVNGNKNVLVRIHSSCKTGDIFHSLRCDCGDQLEKSLKLIEKSGQGVVLYMNQEGRGIGLANKLKSYNLQENGMDTVEANIALGFAPDLRDYSTSAQILFKLGIKSINLITNNPKKVMELERFGVEVSKRISIEIKPTKSSKKYLKTKKEKMGHILKFV
ncbi:MAG: bifunctional 3,4-dihydroxy-2-butanone-4-phosphate synthase/GTP cyclohydrolase II [Endomicrobium sp.]|jgi:3,4-dihydroxy 2-butanone 4-phosphate synthase/GTP cyclohydrolase II|nr:bifunctional 3,4-dihydroxy-2-butanone-4-phosphate synthase/GTP cyclohydrolase II [Endomicrobium sp.]